MRFHFNAYNFTSEIGKGGELVRTQTGINLMSHTSTLLFGFFPIRNTDSSLFNIQFPTGNITSDPV